MFTESHQEIYLPIAPTVHTQSHEDIDGHLYPLARPVPMSYPEIPRSFVTSPTLVAPPPTDTSHYPDCYVVFFPLVMIDIRGFIYAIR